MSTPVCSIIRAVVRAVVAAAATGVAAITLAGNASALDQYVEIVDCKTAPGEQLCSLERQFAYHHGDAPGVRIEFTANNGHCSDIIAKVRVDGQAVAGIIVGPGERDGGVVVPLGPGRHVFSIGAEGLPGGCNTGRLASWGGTVHITNL